LYGHYKKYLNASTFSLPIGGVVDAEKVEIFDSTTITLFKESFNFFIPGLRTYVLNNNTRAIPNNIPVLSVNSPLFLQL
jgi:hypothetical protein